MASTATTFAFALKDYFNPQKVENLCFSDRPFFGRINKNPDFSGENLLIPVQTKAPQNMSSTLALAQTGSSNVGGEQFSFTPGTYESRVEIGEKVMRQSRNNNGAVLQNKVVEIEALYEQHADVVATYQAGNGGNAIGHEGGTWTSGNVLTLSDARDTMNFEIGMLITSDDVDGSGGTGTVRAGYATVTAVDRMAGTVTVDSIAGITGFAQSDYLFRYGDYIGASGTVILPAALQEWVYGSTSPPALGGVTRTTDPQRLAGCYLSTTDCAGLSIEERLSLLGAKMAGTWKAKGPWDVYTNPEDWQVLESALKSQGYRDLSKQTGEFEYTYLQGTLGGHVCKIFGDRFFPKGHAFLLRMKNWTLHSMGPVVDVVQSDGLVINRAATANTFEYRLVTYGVTGNNAPGYNGRCPTGTV